MPGGQDKGEHILVRNYNLKFFVLFKLLFLATVWFFFSDGKCIIHSNKLCVKFIWSTNREEPKKERLCIKVKEMVA